MFRNLFFFTLGLGTGTYATWRVQKKAREVSPQQVGRQVGRRAADRGAVVARQALSFLQAASRGAAQRTSELLDEHNAASSTGSASSPDAATRPTR